MIISEVLATAESEAGPLGEMGGHGISAGGNNGFTKHLMSMELFLNNVRATKNLIHATGY